MAKKAKEVKVTTLFDNYEGYNFEEEKAALQECNPDTTITDEMVWDSIRDMEDEDWSLCKHYLEDVCGDSRVIVSGYAGTWQGNIEAAKIFENVTDALAACVKDCDYMKVMQFPNGLVEVKASHHDGTNIFYLRRVTDKGWDFYDRWNFGYRTHYAHLKEFEILKKIWESGVYSRLIKRVFL